MNSADKAGTDVHGSKAIAGALTRMLRGSNQASATQTDHRPDFGNWGDWDNGHTDHSDFDNSGD